MADIMDDPSYLKQNFETLAKEMANLNALKDVRAQRGEHQIETWLKKVREEDQKVEGMRNEVNYIPDGVFNIKARRKLNKKVVDSYKLVKDLIKMAGEISDTIERFRIEVATEKTLQFSPWQLRSYTSNLAYIVGTGESGIVYRGKFPNGTQIAVKILKADGMKDEMEKHFMSEVRTMGKTYHRNLVKLYGFCFDTQMKALVYEFVDEACSFDKILFEKYRDLPWDKIYGIAIETAKGISYLHENCHQRMVHRDINPGNVLVDSKFCPKMTDFGLAKLCRLDTSQVSLTGFREIRTYDAPEVRAGSTIINYKCDVYSFGMMMFEILRRKRNTDGQNPFRAKVLEMFEKGQLEEVLKECDIEENDMVSAKILATVALFCTHEKAQDRPYMSTVVNVLLGEKQLPLSPNLFCLSTGPSRSGSSVAPRGSARTSAPLPHRSI